MRRLSVKRFALRVPPSSFELHMTRQRERVHVRTDDAHKNRHNKCVLRSKSARPTAPVSGCPIVRLSFLSNGPKGLSISSPRSGDGRSAQLAYDADHLQRVTGERRPGAVPCLGAAAPPSAARAPPRPPRRPRTARSALRPPIRARARCSRRFYRIVSVDHLAVIYSALSTHSPASFPLIPRLLSNAAHSGPPMPADRHNVGE